MNTTSMFDIHEKRAPFLIQLTSWMFDVCDVSPYCHHNNMTTVPIVPLNEYLSCDLSEN